MGIATRSSALAIGFSFPIIGGALVALRFYVRRHLKIPRKIDDWLCLAAWAGVTACCASLLTGVFENVLVEQTLEESNPDAEQQRVLAQVTGAIMVFWVVSNSLIKLSILFFYRRIFFGRAFEISNWIFIVLSFIWTIYGILAWLLYCGTNLRANFEGSWSDCPSWGFKIQMGVFCLDSFIDLGLLILPLPFLWKLRLSICQKGIVVAIFMVGGLAIVAGLNNTIVQLVYLTKPLVAESEGNAGFFQNYGLLVYTWPTVEVGVGLIVCNLPSLSFRAARFLPQKIEEGWNVFLSGLRRATGGRLSLLGFRASESPPSPSIFRTISDGSTEIWDGSGGHDGAKVTITCDVAPITTDNEIGYISKTTEIKTYKVPRGFDAV